MTTDPLTLDMRTPRGGKTLAEGRRREREEIIVILFKNVEALQVAAIDRGRSAQERESAEAQANILRRFIEHLRSRK